MREGERDMEREGYGEGAMKRKGKKEKREAAETDD